MASDDHVVSSTTDTMPNVLTISPTGNVDIDLKQDIQDDEEGITVGSTSLLASQAYLVSPSISNPTLQSLLNTPSAMQGAQLGLPEGIQIITVPSTSDLLPTQTDATGRIWHVINPENAILTVGDVEYKPAAVFRDGTLEDVHIASADLMEASTADVSSILMPPPQQPLPPGCPAWAARLKNCEKIGDYYRGYVDTEVELDILLTYHKQATQSFWGTRQSPSPAKQSTRFMWKSQYVPWDGVPFVNTGSRAVVMECQYGPRRKGSLAKKQSDSGTTGEYKQTCPARIYIKKVRKFPEYKIDPNMDKKSMKNAMDKAFHDLKLQNIEKIGQDRFYVQLPLQSAHEFHDDIPGRGNALATNMGINATQIPTATNTLSGITHTEALEQGDDKHNRLHPMVVQKIRDIVAGGEVRVYHVRRLLRMYVVREICNNSNDMSLQRHDLTLFPTVTDLKNQIHQAVKDIENGTLALTAPTVNVEPMNASGDNMVQIAELNVWPQTMVSSEPVPETVTVTLTQSPGDDGGHVISRIETHLSDGSTQISTSLTPETAQLLARLNPSMFPPGSLVQLQSAGSDVLVEDQQTGMEMNDPVKLEHAATYGGMHMETPESMNHEESPLTIQADSSSSLAILPLENSQSEASNIITTENHSIAEQSSELISVTMVPTVAADMEEELQTDSCDEDL